MATIDYQKVHFFSKKKSKNMISDMDMQNNYIMIVVALLIILGFMWYMKYTTTVLKRIQDKLCPSQKVCPVCEKCMECEEKVCPDCPSVKVESYRQHY